MYVVKLILQVPITAASLKFEQKIFYRDDPKFTIFYIFFSIIISKFKEIVFRLFLP